MALATEPTYSTIDQFKLYTPVSTQTSIVEATWKPFALRAEKILDTYVQVNEDDRFDITQNLKFPIKNDLLQSYLPDDVTLAVIYITSDLILKGNPLPQNGLLTTSETWDAASYSVTGIKKNASSSEDIKIEMPPLARRLLMPWTNKVASLKY